MSPRGGKREGAGKPALYGERMVRTEILIPQEAKEFFISLGEGNLSAGVRMAWRSLTKRASDGLESPAKKQSSTAEVKHPAKKRKVTSRA